MYIIKVLSFLAIISCSSVEYNDRRKTHNAKSISPSTPSQQRQSGNVEQKQMQTPTSQKNDPIAEIEQPVPQQPPSQPKKPNVIVSTDIGGQDPDDFQSMVHLFMYLDKMNLVGLISSPPHGGRVDDIHEVIDAYEGDFEKISKNGSFPNSSLLRSITKQGATSPSPSAGWSSSTDGSKWIIEKALDLKPQPLYILVWGSITDIAQAVKDNPAIKENIRVYSIGSWNTSQDRNARDYLYNQHTDLWWVENDTTFRGMYKGGEQGGEWGNVEFVKQNVKDHGYLGDLFWQKKQDIKMGDTPSVLYILYGKYESPTSESWGGQFQKTSHGPNYWHDSSDGQLSFENLNGAASVNKWRKHYLQDWKDRMDWLK